MAVAVRLFMVEGVSEALLIPRREINLPERNTIPFILIITPTANSQR